MLRKYLSSFCLLVWIGAAVYASPQTVVPGVTWYDTSDNVISAHGAGVIKVGDTYYLIGMYTDNDPNNWMEVSGGHGCPLFVAITCYSSTDFVNWTFENNLLTQQPSGDLGHYRWVGRPKVIYNDTTEEYVMYMNIDDPCALLTQREGKVGVATCSTVDGNYTYLGSFNPLGDTVFDMTLFKDDDGKAYLITPGINIYELTSDYLGVSSQTTKVRDSEAEAPAMFKTGGVYYLLCSKSTWWTSNDNYYWYTTSLTAKRWTEVTDFTPSSPDTCNSQTTYVQPIQGSSTTSFVYLGDRWDEWNFGNSTYVWLPLTLNGTTLTMDCYDEWTLDAETGEWAAVPCTASTTHVESIICGAVSGSQGNKYGQVTVTIYDNCGDPVTNTDVTGTFTGSFNETLTETTDYTGVAVITTTTQQKNPAYTFCVDDVNHATLSYDPNDNLETCGSY